MNGSMSNKFPIIEANVEKVEILALKIEVYLEYVIHDGFVRGRSQFPYGQECSNPDVVLST